MIKNLVDMYERGAITGYQLMIDCLRRLDPSVPDALLSELPGEILDEMLEYAGRHEPDRPHSSPLPLPAEDQVKSAERWIRARHARGAEHVGR